ncbi:MAG: diaminopimelate decarboxylase [Clostridia bacterium]|nr:diaminopimelate decarboxylase [Clostridia bacterium]
MISDSLGINNKNHLTIGGLDTLNIAKEFGTPVYVMDETQIRKNCRLYLDSIKEACGDKGLALYASKAFSCMYMCKLVAEEGMGLDVVSGGELYTAHKAGFPMEKVYFHGNNKTPDELKMAIDFGVGRVVVDNSYELQTLNKLACTEGKTAKVLFRVKPGIDAHTHDFIMTGQVDSKFGFGLETGDAMEILHVAKQLPNIDVVGLHCHIGSQIFDKEPFLEAAEVMTNFIADATAETGIVFKELNLGGGYGIRYVETDNPIGYDEYIGAVAEIVRKIAYNRGIEMPMLLMEPGRSIVGSAGITLYTVGVVKDIPGIRKYVSVDGGMADNPRFIMYDAEYTAIVANNASAEPTEQVTVAGKCCESGDLIIKNATVPRIEVGDTLAILSTGAYNYSMASNYNRIPKPPVVMVREGMAKLIIKRETYEDVLKNDIC